MKWSKLKSLVEAKMSPALDGRVAIYSTAYGNCSCGRAWLTLDKETIANFCTRARWNRIQGDARRENDRWVSDAPVPEHVSESQSDRYGEVEYGELSRQDAYKACWEYVHDLGIDDALASDDPLIQSLAVLDNRVGRKRLSKLADEKFHPLASKLLSLRAEIEGVSVSPGPG